MRTPRHAARSGYTLLELLIVAGLMAFLVVLLGQAWRSLGRSGVDVLARCRVTHEARLALATLSADLGGSLGDNAGRLNGLATGKFVGRLEPGGNQLWLCFDGGSVPNGVADWGSPDTLIVYEVQGDKLLRSDVTAGTTFVVAQYVAALDVIDLQDRVQIQLTFTYRNLSKTFTLIARDP